MKLSSIVCASVVVVAGFALTTDGAFAVAKVKSHSNINNNRDAGCPAGDTTTTGTATDSNGRKMSGATSYGSSASPCATPGNGTPTVTNQDRMYSGVHLPDKTAPATPTDAPATTPPK